MFPMGLRALGFRVSGFEGSGLGVPGFRVSGLGFRVQSLGLMRFCARS